MNRLVGRLGAFSNTSGVNFGIDPVHYHRTPRRLIPNRVAPISCCDNINIFLYE